MDDKADYHSNHVHSQLSCNHLQVSNRDDFSTDEASNTNRGIPEDRVCVLVTNMSGTGKYSI